MGGSNSLPVLRIAIADDNRPLRQLLAKLLGHLGQRVVYAAANGAELVEASKAIEIDVAIVDLDMPVMDGLAAAEELWARKIPVILISGHPDVQHVSEQHEPIAARLERPASLDELEAAIRKAHASRIRTGA